MPAIKVELRGTMLFPSELGLYSEKEGIWNILNVTKGGDVDELRARKVGIPEKCGVIEHRLFREPCTRAVKHALEQDAAEIDFIVEIRLVKNHVFSELNAVKISDPVKFCPPKACTPMEDRAMEIGASLKDRFAECASTVYNGFIEIQIRPKKRAPKVNLLLENNRPKINNVLEGASRTRERFFQKDAILRIAV